MHGERNGMRHGRGTSDPRASTLVYDAIAGDCRASSEPRGLFDPERRCWRALVGRRRSSSRPSTILSWECATRVSAAGTSIDLGSTERSGVDWLVLPMPRPLRPSWCLVVLPAAGPGLGRPEGNEGTGRLRVRGAVGPDVPEPALRLWDRGRQPDAERMRVGDDRDGVGSRRDEESEHVVIGRLIRRLRISDPPERSRPWQRPSCARRSTWRPSSGSEGSASGDRRGGGGPGSARVSIAAAPAGCETTLISMSATTHSRSVPPGPQLCFGRGRVARLAARGQPAR